MNATQAFKRCEKGRSSIDEPRPREPVVPPRLGDLRGELDAIDLEIVRLIAQRLTTVTRIGVAKERGTKSVRDVERERLVLNQVEEEAVRLGISASFVRGIFQSIIEHSVSLQAARLEAGEGGLSGVTANSTRFFE